MSRSFDPTESPLSSQPEDKSNEEWLQRLKQLEEVVRCQNVEMEQLKLMYVTERDMRLKLEKDLAAVKVPLDSDNTAEDLKKKKRKKRDKGEVSQIANIPTKNAFGILASKSDDEHEFMDTQSQFTPAQRTEQKKDGIVDSQIPSTSGLQSEQQKKEKQKRKQDEYRGTQEEFPSLPMIPAGRRVITRADGIRIVEKIPESPAEVEMTESQEERRRDRKPPFITLVNKGKYRDIKCAFAAQQEPVKIDHATETRGGIRIYPATAQDFRAAVRVIDAHQAERFTFTLAEDLQLKVVIRGVPIDFTEEEILQDIREQGFLVESVKRMRRNKDTPYSMVMATTEKSEEGKRLFNIRKLLGLNVRTEPKRRQTGKTQCFRCQRFGHVQLNCTLPPRCAFCAKDHQSRDCTKTRGPGKEATCANCEGAHPAFASGCPKHPLNRTARQARGFDGRAAEVRPNISFASAAQPRGSQVPEESFEVKIAKVLRQLLPELIREIYG